MALIRINRQQYDPNLRDINISGHNASNDAGATNTSLRSSLTALRPPQPKVLTLTPDLTELPEKLEKARDALRYIDASCERSTWIMVGMTLHDFEPDIDDTAFELWDAWSATSEKYPGSKETRQIWGSFKPKAEGRGVTLGSLFRIAKQNGWVPPVPTPSDPPLKRLEREWNSFSSEGESEYFQKKGLPIPENAKFGRDSGGPFVAFMLENFDEELRGILRTYNDGVKRLAKDSQKNGNFISIQFTFSGRWTHSEQERDDYERSQRIYICEGVATALSVDLATQEEPVFIVAAVDCGNLEAVTQVICNAYPRTTIVICGDDDRENLHNPGRHHAEKAARQHGCLVAFPKFKHYDGKNTTDFDDLRRLEGPDEVRRQIKAAEAPPPLERLEDVPEEGQVAWAKQRVEDLVERTKQDAGAPFVPETLKMLALLREQEPTEWARIRQGLCSKATVSMGDLEQAMGKHGKQDPHGSAKSEEASHESVIEEINREFAVVFNKGDLCVLREHEDGTISLTGKQDLIDWYARHPPVMVGEKPINRARYWFAHSDRREYVGITCDPRGTPDRYFNLYKGRAVIPEPGDCSIYKELVFEVICAGNQELGDYVWRWLAHMFQKPGEIPGTALVLRGAQGIGKDTFTGTVGKLLGTHYLMITGHERLTGRFNGHLANALLVYCNEAVWGGDRRQAGVLKSLITDPDQLIEYKGREPFTLPNFKRFVFSSNENWAVPRDLDDRRFLVLDVSAKRKEDHVFFGKLHDQITAGTLLPALLHELLDTDLTDFNVRRLPDSPYGLDMKFQSLDSVGQWWFECLRNGEIEIVGRNNDRIKLVGWEREVGTLYIERQRMRDDGYLHWCKNQGVKHPMSDNLFGKRLRQLCPEMPEERRTENGERKRYDRFPSLAECRRHFETAAKTSKIEWPEPYLSEEKERQRSLDGINASLLSKMGIKV